MITPQRIMIMAWGSRGDIQPVIALALGLQKAGRDVLLFATPPASDLIIAHQLPCVVAEENVAIFLETIFDQTDLSDRSFRGLMKTASIAKAYQQSADYQTKQTADMHSALEAAQHFKPDLLITPNLFYGYYTSLAETLQIPVITFDLQINHPTVIFPLFTMELGKFPSFLNRTLYRIKALIYSRSIQKAFHTMRSICALPEKYYLDGSPLKIWPHDLPQVCATSTHLCQPPHDWPVHKIISGWWTLPQTTVYQPPPELSEFLKERPVYIGFGSMKGNAHFRVKLSTLAIKSLQLANTKGILLGGWAGLSRNALDTSTEEGQQLYAWAQQNVFEIDDCPHDWLFPQCAAVIHHGGAGTLAAGLRAGCPNIICALLGDQPFHGSLVATHGVGHYLGVLGSANVHAERVAQAIHSATTDTQIIEAARTFAQQCALEEGVQNTLHFIDHTLRTFTYPWPIKPYPSRLPKTQLVP